MKMKNLSVLLEHARVKTSTLFSGYSKNLLDKRMTLPQAKGDGGNVMYGDFSGSTSDAHCYCCGLLHPCLCHLSGEYKAMNS